MRKEKGSVIKMVFCGFVKTLRGRDNLTQAQFVQYLNVNVNIIKQIILEQIHILSRYMAYLYSKGWNIDEAPVTYHTNDFSIYHMQVN